MFSIREAFIGLRRNGLTAFIAVGVIFFSLLIFGLFLVGTFNLFGVIRIAESKVEIDAYLSDDISLQDVNNLKSKISKIVGVKSVNYLSKESAMEKFKKEMKNAPELLKALETNPLPPSFKISVKEGYNSPEDIKKIASKIRIFGGVEDVQYGEVWIKRLDKLVKILFLFDVVVGLVISFASIFVVSNTIRLTVISRKESIEVMRLVGATDRMIRSPFMLEGVIEGGVGGGVSAGILYGLYILSQKFVSYFFPTNILFGALVIFGIILGYIGSRNAVKTYLIGGEG